MNAKQAYKGGIVGLVLALLGVAGESVAQNSPTPGAAQAEVEKKLTPVEALVAGVNRIAQADLPTAQKNSELATYIARAVVRLGEGSPRVVAQAAAQLDPALLPVVVSSAMVASGHLSPDLYASLLTEAGTTPELRETITRHARNPALALDAAVLAALPVLPMPAPVAPPPAPSDVDVGDIPLEVYERPVGERRPPAPPYRGQ